MPIYEYGCAACGHEFEEWQKISDPPIRRCPACGKRRVTKLVSRSSFHLKGGGWYADLYSSRSGSNGKSSGSASSSSSSESPSSKEKSSTKTSPSSQPSTSTSKS